MFTRVVFETLWNKLKDNMGFYFWCVFRASNRQLAKSDWECCVFLGLFLLRNKHCLNLKHFKTPCLKAKTLWNIFILFKKTLKYVHVWKTGYVHKPVWKSKFWLKVSSWLLGFESSLKQTMFQTCLKSMSIFKHCFKINMFEKVWKIGNYMHIQCMHKCT